MDPTPGPWRRSARAIDAIICDTPVHPSDKPGEDTHSCYGGFVICESVAPQNRGIICATPGLMAVAEGVLNLIGENGELNFRSSDLGTLGLRELAQSAIDKARGKT